MQEQEQTDDIAAEGGRGEEAACSLLGFNHDVDIEIGTQETLDNMSRVSVALSSRGYEEKKRQGIRTGSMRGKSQGLEVFNIKLPPMFGFYENMRDKERSGRHTRRRGCQVGDDRHEVASRGWSTIKHRLQRPAFRK